MPDFEFDAQDKIVQKMTRDGLVEENAATGEQENVSSKKADYEYNALRAAEVAINVAGDIHYHNKIYSSSAEAVPEDDIPEEDGAAYKSPYNHGEYQNRQSGAASAEGAAASEGDEDKDRDHSKKTGEKRHGKRKEDDSSRFTHESGKRDYKFERRTDRTQKKLDRFDRKIAKAEQTASEKQKKLPEWRTERLKFVKSEVKEKNSKTTPKYKLKYVTTNMRKLTEKEYNDLKKDRWKKKELKRAFKTSVLSNSWSEIRRKNRDEIHESEFSAARRTAYYGRQKYKKANDTFEYYFNPYAQIRRAQEKAAYYRLRRDETEYKNLPRDQKKYQKQLQKKRYKKAALEKNLKEGEQRILRHRNIFTKAKDALVRIIKAVKAVVSITGSVLSLTVILFALIFGMIILLIIALGFTGESMIRSTYQADYSQISGCTAYMQSQETDLKEHILKIETEEYPDCYEYHYQLEEFGQETAPLASMKQMLENIGHDSIALMSYLAARYVEFDLERCQGELDSVFSEMYTLKIEIKEEERKRVMKDVHGNSIYDENGEPVMELFLARICYVTLQVKPLEKIIEERLTDAEQKEAYDTYMLSSGGQQVYANCLTENWEGKISSKFGERIHPITGERTFHNGVDIAVPENTPLYSSTPGVVTTSAYSETAGNYIIVTMEGGWSVKYMHLNAREVSAGDVVKRGQFLGQTGNTGRSTGPHLHLEVRDAVNNPIDPAFIIPCNSVIIENEEGEI